MHKLLVFSVFFLCTAIAYGQHRVFIVEGTVHGYEHNESQGILKKSKSTLLEGTLEDATIQILRNGLLIDRLQTNDMGLFDFELHFDDLYEIIISKKGYNTNQLFIDTRAFPTEIKQGGFSFSGAEFVLNSFKNGQDSTLNKRLGRLHYNPGKKEFSLAGKSQSEQVGLFVTNIKDASYELLQRAISKNNEQLLNYKPLSPPRRYTHRPVEQSPTPPREDNSFQNSIEGDPADSLNTDLAGEEEEPASGISPVFDLNPLFTEIDPELIRVQEDAIRREKEQLILDALRAQTHDDSLEILRRERQIELAEKEIKNARLLIITQDEKLSAQRNSLYLMIGLLLLTSGFTALVFFHFKQKQKTSRLIESKNRQITDSINYARRIQQSILISENKICEYLPESFVFLQARDIVSGDFYFVAPVGNSYLVAVADCTGHGVPGAFMSLIGHRLLREIVLEKNITDPALLLDNLHYGIIESLNQAEGLDYSQDGMDIAVCLIDPQQRKLTFAGAMHPVYLMSQEHGLQVLQGDISSVGGKSLRPKAGKEKKKFHNKSCTYNANSMLYMFTDGYMDQFGGQDDQKFNTRRFKQLLNNIHGYSAAAQKEAVADTLNNWKQGYAQTDDILLLGIRLA